MPEIKIMSIQDLLHLHALKDNENILIIFVTTKPNYYNFGSTRFIRLDIADTEAPKIEREDIFHLRTILYAMLQCYRQHMYHIFKTIYVCCDAGLSRSPAVAFFIATKLNDRKQALEIDDKYRFLNLALFRKLMVEV